MRCQNRRRSSRAPSRPPSRPCRRSATAPFMAPALVALMPSSTMRSSSSRRSSTPQVKAPWAPPPWRARLTVLTDTPEFVLSMSVGSSRSTAAYRRDRAVAPPGYQMQGPASLRHLPHDRPAALRRGCGTDSRKVKRRLTFAATPPAARSLPSACGRRRRGSWRCPRPGGRPACGRGAG